MSAEQVLILLRQVIAGEVQVQLSYPERSWRSIYAGNVSFKMGSAEVVIFNDCDSLDYIDHILMDGVDTDFDDWPKNPIAFLDSQEYLALQQILEEAR